MKWILFFLVTVVLVSGCTTLPTTDPGDTGEGGEGITDTEASPSEDIPDDFLDAALAELDLTEDLDSGSVEISMTAKQWEFDPSVIEVKEGDRVILHVTSIDVSHGIVIPSFGVNANLAPGEETIVSFVADQKGSFSFICSVFCGSGHIDMKGTLIVS